MRRKSWVFSRDGDMDFTHATGRAFSHNFLLCRSGLRKFLPRINKGTTIKITISEGRIDETSLRVRVTAGDGLQKCPETGRKGDHVIMYYDVAAHLRSRAGDKPFWITGEVLA